LRWTRIADFVDDVADTVRQLPSQPILIGHSMGGFIIQKYLEQYSAPAAVLLSSAAPTGLLPTALKIAWRRPIVFAKVNLTLSLLPLIANPQLAREAFFSSDLTDEILEEYWGQMEEESFMAFLDMVALDRPKPAKIKTPLLVLGAGRDNMLRPADIEATARAYHTQSEFIPGVAHNSMLETRWETVAERILTWLDEVTGTGTRSLSTNYANGWPATYRRRGCVLSARAVLWARRLSSHTTAVKGSRSSAGFHAGRTQSTTWSRTRACS
jgi:pimeloyl-ACP methyl ester carboxylesterase